MTPADQLVSKQTVGLHDVHRLKNGQEEGRDRESEQRDKSLDGSKGEAPSNRYDQCYQ